MPKTLMEEIKEERSRLYHTDRAAWRANIHANVYLHRFTHDMEAALLIGRGVPAAELRNRTTGAIPGPEIVNKMSKMPLHQAALNCMAISPLPFNISPNDAPDAIISAALRRSGGERYLAGGSGYTGISSEYHPGDFPRLLNNVVNTLVDRAMMRASASFYRWTAELSELPSLLNTPLVNISGPGRLSPALDGHPHNLAKLIDEQMDHVHVARFSDKIALSPLTLANDGTKALQRAAEHLAQAAAGTTTSEAVGVLVRPDALGNELPLFHADNGNLITSGAGVPGFTTFTEMQKKMALQRTPTGEYSQARPVIVLVPPVLEMVARKELHSTNIAAAKRAMADGSTVEEGIEIVSEPELLYYDQNAWFALANPAMFPAIVRCYYTGWGQAGRRETWTDNSTGCLNIALEHRVGVGAINYRHIVKNPGV